ncbi:MAG: hypothetical protein AAF270_04135 [Pseudomonadota bacterium]
MVANTLINQPVGAEQAVLAVEQLEPVPLVSDTTTEVTFNLQAHGGCPETRPAAALVLNLADTVISAALDDAPQPTSIALVVPMTQLVGLQRGLLCERLGKVAETENAIHRIPDAFSAQVTTVCESPDLPATRTASHVTLDVEIDCSANQTLDAAQEN